MLKQYLQKSKETMLAVSQLKNIVLDYLLFKEIMREKLWKAKLFSQWEGTNAANKVNEANCLW